MSNVKIEELEAERTWLAFDPMRQLRPHLTSAGFVRLVNEEQRPQGYRLVGSWDGESGRVVAAAGFRESSSLAYGRHLLVDDLTTMPNMRGRGHATRLLAWVEREARRLGCAQIHLDAGTHRHDAHRLFLRTGFTIPSFHFARRL
ncbi:GNAT family N-acetyltransferase [Frankia sp. CcI49]|uniref:Acetyltransferase (GNAT) family protein n=1 Tax=Parafrankia irregularis TaxID=795642 RepID=A0A0S4QDY7_9ACTN|nr:GCN5-related N-acetyltransferase [Parafrankia sp. EUN1f]KPM55006.1 acetyltransferase [Frankia sp. R43]ONH56159.1 GNAT family N-acetyltransferase [Frankia sp. CcI49]CUU53683.1 Acetyltransferase (GNAT) family protein [Parafrankia irregularis]